MIDTIEQESALSPTHVLHPIIPLFQRSMNLKRYVLIQAPKYSLEAIFFPRNDQEEDYNDTHQQWWFRRIVKSMVGNVVKEHQEQHPHPHGVSFVASEYGSKCTRETNKALQCWPAIIGSFVTTNCRKRHESFVTKTPWTVYYRSMGQMISTSVYSLLLNHKKRKEIDESMEMIEQETLSPTTSYIPSSHGSNKEKRWFWRNQKATTTLKSIATICSRVTVNAQ